ncbi:MAG: aquaporin [Planctomycetota bacterium]
MRADQAVAERRELARPRQRPTQQPPSLWRCCVAELLGTFLLVLLGCGAVHASVLAHAQSGVFQVAIVWGIAVAIAIHGTRAISGAYLNPAMTVAFAAFGTLPKARVPAYCLAQLLGAFVAGALLYGCFGGWIRAAEAASGIARGAPGSEAIAMCYGEYFPNPGAGTDASAFTRVSEAGAFLAELVGTAILALVVFALTEPRNGAAPGSALTPALIGLTVAALISVIAPLTQACFNPARDLGPRLFAWLAGWGTIALPGPRGGCITVYILAPICGALLGAAAFRFLLQPSYRSGS